MSKTIFVDGAAGTVGLALNPHLDVLKQQGFIKGVIELDENERLDVGARQWAMQEADIVVLCLPDDVAVDAARMAMEINPDVRILDASAAHRCNPAWVYGMPEVASAEVISAARLVANPGCFATACILAAFPLRHVRTSFVFHGLTGYSAAGRRLGDKPEGVPRLTQFGLLHRHIPEIMAHAGVSPVLTTFIGDWYQGMLVQTNVDLPSEKVLKVVQDCYSGSTKVLVTRAEDLNYKVDPQACNGTNNALIAVAGQPDGTSSIAVVLDNLGRGSAANAAHNLRLMLEGV